jgi:hypothetical protein
MSGVNHFATPGIEHFEQEITERTEMRFKQRKAGLGIRMLAKAAGIEYMSAATAIRRFLERAENDPTTRKLIEQSERQNEKEYGRPQFQRTLCRISHIPKLPGCRCD